MMSPLHRAIYDLPPEPDPDAPSRSDPKWGEWRHWMVFNIPGAHLAKGQEWWTYIGAGPPKDTGLHRYIFLSEIRSLCL